MNPRAGCADLPLFESFLPCMLTVNTLAAADSVLIPVQAQYLSAKGLEQLLQTINKVRKQINPKLKIDGILLTMVDNRTNDAKEISTLLWETYGTKLKVFDSVISTPSGRQRLLPMGKASSPMIPRVKWQKLIEI